MTPSTTTIRRHAALVLALVTTLVLVIGCGGTAASIAGPAEPAPQDGPTRDKALFGLAGASAAPVAGAFSGSVAPGAGDPSQVLDAARPDLLIIKTGNLELQVKAIEESTTNATKAVTALGGYISSSEQYGEAENLTASITYRVPSDKWDEAVAALRGLAIKVLTAQTQTQDVTGQVVDLSARITNLKASESALQSIMGQATKIADVLAVQSELTAVRGEIEQATAEKQHLQEQASFSTLAVRFSLKPDPAVLVSQQKFDPKDQVDRASASLVEVLQGLATAGIWFAIVWLPILLVLAVIVGLVAWVLRRRNAFGRPAPAGASAFPLGTGESLPTGPETDDPSGGSVDR